MYEYINYPGLGLGFVYKRSGKIVRLGIISTGEYKIVSVDDVKAWSMPTIKIDQLGLIKLYEYIKVRTSHESYILQLLKISESGCTFAKFWKVPGTRHCSCGVLVLDSNDFFSVERKIMKLRKLSKLPFWLGAHKNSPIIQFKDLRAKILNKDT